MTNDRRTIVAPALKGARAAMLAAPTGLARDAG